MVFYFLWDASIFDRSGQFLLTIDHDEFFSVASSDERLIETLRTSLKRYGYQARKVAAS
jgi:hypothetical protein